MMISRTMKNIKAIIKKAAKPTVIFWFQLPKKDQHALSLMIGFSGLLLLTYGFLLPAYSFHQDSKQGYSEQKELHHWLTSKAEEIAVAPKKASRATPQASPLSSINNSAKQHQLTIKRIQPQADNSVKVWLEQASFSKATQWLTALETDGFMVQELNMEKQSPGIINMRASVWRP